MHANGERPVAVSIGGKKNKSNLICFRGTQVCESNEARPGNWSVKVQTYAMKYQIRDFGQLADSRVLRQRL